MEYLELIFNGLWVGICLFGIVNSLKYGFGKGENGWVVVKMLLFVALLAAVLLVSAWSILTCIVFAVAAVGGGWLGWTAKLETSDTLPDGWNYPTWPPHDVD